MPNASNVARGKPFGGGERDKASGAGAKPSVMSLLPPNLLILRRFGSYNVRYGVPAAPPGAIAMLSIDVNANRFRQSLGLPGFWRQREHVRLWQVAGLAR